jgi:hypothetical protein
MAESRDNMPAATGRGKLRASHADREQVISTLKAAFVQGRLAKDEFDLRVGQTFASRTYAELAAVTADLPAGLTEAQPPKPAAVRRVRPGAVVVGANVLYAGMWPVSWFLPRAGFELVMLSGVAYLIVIAAALVWWRMLEARRGKDSGGQRPRRQASGTGRQAFPRPPSASPRDKLLPGDQGRPYTAEAARRRLSPPLSPVRGHCIGMG